MPCLPEPRDVGATLGTLMTAQAAIAALTLAVTLFMMQGIGAKRDVDDRMYREYVRRSRMRDILWGSLLAVGVTGILLISDGFISGDGAPTDVEPELRNLVLAAALAFLLNLVLAGVLFERAIFYSRPAQWMALRRDVNKADVRKAVQAFLRRARRALDAHEAEEPDFSALFPDRGEGSADEAVRALLDDARRAMSERRHEEVRRSLDSVRELVKYAMDEIKETGIQWSAPGAQAEWPPLRELSRNLNSFREDVIREGDREYILELLSFDYWLAIEGVRERCGELFTVGLSGYRWNYQIATRIGSEFREMLRDRFALNAEGLILGAEPAEMFLYAREMVRQQERLLSDAMHSHQPTDYGQLHKDFHARLQAIRLHWGVNDCTVRDLRTISSVGARIPYSPNGTWRAWHTSSPSQQFGRCEPVLGRWATSVRRSWATGRRPCSRHLVWRPARFLLVGRMGDRKFLAVSDYRHINGTVSLAVLYTTTHGVIFGHGAGS